MTDKELQVLLTEALGDEPEERQPSCPSLEDLARFVENPAPSPFAEEIRAHLLACRRCAAEVAHLSLAQENFARRRGEIRRRIVALTQGKPMQHASRFTFHVSPGAWLLRQSSSSSPSLRSALSNPRRAKMKSRSATAMNASPRRTLSRIQVTMTSLPNPHRSPSHHRAKRTSLRPVTRHPFLVNLSEAAKAFLAAASAEGSRRSGGTPDESPLTPLKPNLTIILSQTPELVAKASPGVAGSFTFQVDEVEVVGKGLQGIEGREDVVQTKDTPVDKPSLTLTKPLERGKVYAWRVSAGEQQSAWAYFMVAEQSVVDAAKQYAHPPATISGVLQSAGALSGRDRDFREAAIGASR